MNLADLSNLAVLPRYLSLKEFDLIHSILFYNSYSYDLITANDNVVQIFWGKVINLIERSLLIFIDKDSILELNQVLTFDESTIFLNLLRFTLCILW